MVSAQQPQLASITLLSFERRDRAGPPPTSPHCHGGHAELFLLLRLFSHGPGPLTTVTTIFVTSFPLASRRWTPSYPHTASVRACWLTAFVPILNIEIHKDNLSNVLTDEFDEDPLPQAGPMLTANVSTEAGFSIIVDILKPADDRHSPILMPSVDRLIPWHGQTRSPISDVQYKSSPSSARKLTSRDYLAS
ncbi:hypothetical protein BJV77DRAFT_1162639 [Russula vinacea]|nr:hypothetical protein BJV77DRAFT_1162639 [Russula vinacea]